MASLSSDYQNGLWEAARDMDIPDARDEMCWPMLKMFLKSKVDLTARKQEEWLKSFDRLRKVLRKEEKGATAERSSSTESERKSDVGSLPDSGYDSGSPRDNVCYAPLFWMISVMQRWLTPVHRMTEQLYYLVQFML